MPTYTYRCKKCSQTVDIFHGMSATPKIACPACKAGCVKTIGTGAGIIFKGSGFYETDYKRSKTGQTGEAGSDGAKSDSKSETKTEAKTEAKTAKKAAAAE